MFERSVKLGMITATSPIIGNFVKEKPTVQQLGKKKRKVLNLAMIKENLLRDEVLQPCVLSPPLVCCYTSVSKNSSDEFANTNSSSVLTAQDEEFVKILEYLDCSKITSENANLSNESRLCGYFCSYTVFNLNKRCFQKRQLKCQKKVYIMLLYRGKLMNRGKE